MNPIERAIRRVDAVQQRHKVPAFVSGIARKYGHDNGGVLVFNHAYSGFVSLFPLIGHQLAGNVHELRRSSVIGLAAGLLALTWGTTGLARRACSRWRRCGTC